ncbi:hypothetical protein Ocin01_00504 [Orchesella cincta]|uniref:Uncharacterized protein n=1 Tax=Orchesella cincta TaxID=48709 RepID=A0A1D2NLR8_ORCCI|nr:hypothetical protein Ocin01_00504 [Orchesella cincta]
MRLRMFGWNSLNIFLMKWIFIAFICKILARIFLRGAINPEEKAAPASKNKLKNSTDYDLSLTSEDLCTLDADELFLHPFRDFLALALCIAWYMLRKRIMLRKQEAVIRKLQFYQKQLEISKKMTKRLRSKLRKQYSKLFDHIFDFQVALGRLHPPPIADSDDDDRDVNV